MPYRPRLIQTTALTSRRGFEDTASGTYCHNCGRHLEGRPFAQSDVMEAHARACWLRTRTRASR
jgi:hypothetical protein